MKNLYLILVILTFIFISGCENVDVINPETNYEEDIVVRAELKANEIFKGVTFTRTLPLNENYDIKKAELKNVTAYLKINDFRIVTLKYSSDGLYTPLDSIRIKNDYKYELFAKVDSITIYSVTTVPSSPKIQNASLIDNRLITVTVKPTANEVYGAAWEILNGNSVIDEANDFQTIVQPSDNELNSTISVNTKDLPEDYTAGSFRNLLYAKVVSFDTPYFEYFKSRNNNQPSENIFAQGGDLIAWNVKGDHVIGLFIGLSESQYKVKF